MEGDDEFTGSVVEVERGSSRLGGQGMVIERLTRCIRHRKSVRRTDLEGKDEYKTFEGHLTHSFIHFFFHGWWWQDT